MATITIPNFTTGQKVVSGLNTYQYTVASAAMHVAHIEVDHHLSSQLTVSIQQNGSTISTITLPGTTQVQGTAILVTTMNCALNDVISFVLSSSASVDNQTNTVKSRLIVKVGSSN